MVRQFDRYVLRELLPPFLIGLAVYSFVLLMNQILLLGEMFIDKGVTLGEAARVLLLLLPSILAFAVPMAVLMGILAGLSRMSTDSEVVALKTLGIGFGRLLRPVLLFALAGWAATSVLTLVVAPRANYRWVRVYSSSILAKVQVRIAPREFNESIPDMVVYIREIEPDGGWRDVLLWSRRNPNEPEVILARRGRLRVDGARRTALVELFDGASHSVPADDPSGYNVTSFRSLALEVDLAPLFPTLDAGKRVREKDIGELVAGRRGLETREAALRARAAAAPADPDAARELRNVRRDLRAHGVEIHKKFALPFACLIFVLVGLPLGVSTRKGGRTSGFTVSVAIILVYYILITAGEEMAMTGRIAPWLGMWGPNLLLLLVGADLFGHALRESSPFSGLRRPRRARRSAGPRERAAAGPDGAATVPFRPRRRLRVAFPNILDRYIARKALLLGVLFVAGLVCVSLIITFFDQVDNVYAHGKPLRLFLSYLGYRVPEFLSYALPVAMLAAAILALGLLAKFNEITAMKACGVSVHRAVVPVLVLAAAVSAAAFGLQERVLPWSSARAQDLWNRINDLPPQSYSYVNRHWAWSRTDDRVFHYDFFDPVSGSFSKLSVFEIDGPRWTLTRRLSFERARLKGDRLTGRGGWVRTFAEGRPEGFREVTELELAAGDPKAVFLREWKEPAQMTVGELRAYTAEAGSRGFDTSRLRMELHRRFAFPLASVIMTLLSVPFAFMMGKRGTLVGLGLAVVLSMVYWNSLGMFKGLGDTGVLGPFLAAWGPDLLFGLAGSVFVFRLRS